MSPEPTYQLEECALTDVRPLFEEYHGYGGVGASATYCYGVVESGVIVAAYVWSPPPRGAARSACPEEPSGVLALSRMVAVPRAERALNHISKPLRR